MLEGSVAYTGYVCILTGWPGGGAIVLLFSSRDVACQRFGRPGQGRPLLWAAVCSLLNEHTHTEESIQEARCIRAWTLVPAPCRPSVFLSFYLLCPFVWQSGRVGTCRGGTDLSELCLSKGAPFKATGRAGPGGMVVIRCPALNCHL